MLYYNLVKQCCTRLIERRRNTNSKYLHPAHTFEEAGARLAELTETCSLIEKRIIKYPKGKIHVVNSNRGTQYYLRNDAKDKSGEYLSKKDVKKISLYAQKKYDYEVLKLIKEEIKAWDEVLRKLRFLTEKLPNSYSVLIQNIYSKTPLDIKEKITPIDVSDKEFVEKWFQQPFVKKTVSDEVTTYITTNGERVRSKSELTIANALAKNCIPYKYEYPFKLTNGRIIYPDFTILNLKTRKEIIWEHRGMMDDEEYFENSVYRIKQLQREGLILGSSLVITEETKEWPLGTDEIERIINYYL